MQVAEEHLQGSGNWYEETAHPFAPGPGAGVG